MTELHLATPDDSEAPVTAAANLAGIVDIEAYLEDRERLLEVVGAITVSGTGTPGGRDWVRRVAESDIRLHPGQLPEMVVAVEDAVERLRESGRVVPLKRSDVHEKLHERAAWLNLPDHWMRVIGLKPDLTDDEAYKRVEADLTRHQNGLPRQSKLRNLGTSAVNFLKKEGLL